MAQKQFTKEEMATLKQSPYVASVSTTRVKFTPEFKRMAYQEITNGKTVRTVLKESGIDPDILGDSRVWALAQNLRKDAEREEGFEDLRYKNSRSSKPEAKAPTMEERIAQLEHELAYTRQEVEFLKKIQAADLEARKSWESRQRRK